MSIVDFHTHNPSARDALISVSPLQFQPQPGLFYSVGIHPWDTASDGLPQALTQLEAAASHEQALAIGETGLDARRGAPLEVQWQVLQRHVELSRRLGKPLVIHTVHTAQLIVKAWKQLADRSVPWAVHGVRWGLGTAQMLLDCGFYLSFGPKFNAATLAATPCDRILLETDDSPASIRQVASQVAASLGITAGQVLSLAAANASGLLNAAGHEADA